MDQNSGFKIIRKLKFILSNIIVESDCKMIIDMCNTKSTGQTDLHVILSKFRVTLSYIQTLGWVM